MSDPAPPPSVAALIEALGDEDAARRAQAARDLTRLGPAAISALPALVEALADPVFLVRAMAAAAIGRQGEDAAPQALAPLVRRLEDPVAPVRFWAADSLGRMPAAARSVLATLELRMADDDPAVRGAATRAVALVRRASSGDA